MTEKKKPKTTEGVLKKDRANQRTAAVKAANIARKAAKNEAKKKK